ncbi:MAG: hypothetical protein KAW17_07645 [Candidatus Eisenbacteria sp.]|nr:hypothetical protein [Candidatus Eisenbacteria bacterium]
MSANPSTHRPGRALHAAASFLIPAALLLLLTPTDAGSRFWPNKDWENRKHKLKVCLSDPRGRCPAGMADSIKTAIAIWDSTGLTWQFTWTDSCDSADIKIQCKVVTGLGKCRQHPSGLSGGTYTIDRATIDINPLKDWGWCDDKQEIVDVIMHELGHCAMLMDINTNDQTRLMRAARREQGHSRGLSKADSLEAASSDTSGTVGVNSAPQGAARHNEYSGIITAAPGTPPLNLSQAQDIVLTAFQPEYLEILEYWPMGEEEIFWRALPISDQDEMQVYFVAIDYERGWEVRQGILYVTNFPWEPGWAPVAVAPADTVVPNDTSQVILDYQASTHPSGLVEVVSFAWVVDDTIWVEGGPVTSIMLPEGPHLVELLAMDEYGLTDRDTMFVLVEESVTGVLEERDLPAPANLRLDFQVPFRMGGRLAIRYDLPRLSDVELTVYDTRGRRVATLVKGVLPPGQRETAWNLRDSHGHPVAPGIYFCSLRVGESRTLRKMVLVD